MDKTVIIVLLDDIVNRLDRAIEAAEGELPDDMSRPLTSVLGGESKYYPATSQLWDLSSDIERILKNFRSGGKDEI